MDCLLSYTLLEKTKQKTPTAGEIEELIKFVGGKSDSAKAQALIKALSGKNTEELIAKGSSMLQSAAPVAATAAAPVADTKKVEEAEESEEESSGDMDLFG